jgi:futalosine hydrolase
MRVLVACAVDAEADAVRTGAPHVAVRTVGVGPAAAAAGTAAALAAAPYDLVLSAGIGGGFAPLAPGAVAVAADIVFADLGAETADGFAPASALGFGVERYPVDPQLAVELADRTGGHLGSVLTVATVTGTAATADALVARHPDAVAEAMEGAGVAAAATAAGVPFAELRAISNLVGPRDRDAWQIPAALAALGRAVAAAVPEGAP